MAKPDNGRLWELAHTERATLAEDLSGLSAEQWRHVTLCGQWNVEDVVAHLIAAASVNQWQWIRSMLGARFRPGVHNQRRLAEHRGNTSAETLDRFRAIITSTTAPSGHLPAYLGEVVVHAQDIRHPLGLPRTPSVDALTPVAEFFASRDFTVASRTHTAGLQLRADDGPFATGAGPVVVDPGTGDEHGRPGFLPRPAQRVRLVDASDAPPRHRTMNHRPSGAKVVSPQTNITGTDHAQGGVGSHLQRCRTKPPKPAHRAFEVAVTFMDEPRAH